MPRPIEAVIHPAALAHNLQRAREQAPDARVWAVVKANAYGHGIERAFEGLVTDLEEIVRAVAGGVRVVAAAVVEYGGAVVDDCPIGVFA